MVESRYKWEQGVELDEHTKRKHKILREYFARYLEVRCGIPQQSRFRLALVDGFAGGGRYRCGAPGSPLIFIEELQAAASRFNVKRQAEGWAPIDIECFLILNDATSDTIRILEQNVAPLLAQARAEAPRLHLQIAYREKPFEALYPEVKALLAQGRYQNVLFNLDQYGHSDVQLDTLADISVSFTSAEVIHTFAIASLLAFLRKTKPDLLAQQLAFLGVTVADLAALDGQMSKPVWLGAAERLVFECFRGCARFVSPFSINNPDGWRYWLIHLANNYRARQEYNNVLHQNSTMQAHFGRSGLNMLSFDPSQQGALYLFDVSGREGAKRQLREDIPRLVTDFGDAIPMGLFYASIYNMTPAHMDDIHTAIMDNTDLEVVTTEGGGTRRKPNAIRADDTLRMKQQPSFFPIFFGPKKDKIQTSMLEMLILT